MHENTRMLSAIERGEPSVSALDFPGGGAPAPLAVQPRIERWPGGNWCWSEDGQTLAPGSDLSV